MAQSPYTIDDLLEIWRRIFPLGFVTPIESEAGGQGLDIYAQQAAQFARVSEAISTNTQAYYLKSHSDEVGPCAQGGQKATGQITVSRMGDVGGPVTLDPGVELVSMRHDVDGELTEGERFTFESPVVFAVGDAGPYEATVVAVREGYQGNLPSHQIESFAPRGFARVVNASIFSGNQIRDLGIPDRFTQGMIGQYISFETGANINTYARKILSVSFGATSTITVDGPALIFPDTAVINVLEFASLGIVLTQDAPTSGGRNAYLDAIGYDRNSGRVPGETDTDYRTRLATLADVVTPGAINRICLRILSPLAIAYSILERPVQADISGFIWNGLQFVEFVPDGHGPERYFIIRIAYGNQGNFGEFYDRSNPAARNFWGLSPYDGYPFYYFSAVQALYVAVERARAAGIRFDLIFDPSL